MAGRLQTLDEEMLPRLLLSLANMGDYLTLFGLNDQNLRTLEEELGVTCALRGQELHFSGSPEGVSAAETVVRKLTQRMRRGGVIDPRVVRYAAQLYETDQLDALDEADEDIVAFTHRGKAIKCMTLGQREYARAVREHELTFAVGPAGTGKTYLAMAMAVAALRERAAERLILTRPAVEAGEKLGFLPGDMAQKVDPYLRPLYDALYEMAGADACQRLTERGTLEVAPLAFMRGRTLSNAFIILDEAQNATPEQMKMFLTRLGAGSKCVVTGDLTQTDLPAFRRSGLREATDILKNVPGVAVMELNDRDVVRHELVRRIVKAYEEYERGKAEEAEKRNERARE